MKVFIDTWGWLVLGDNQERYHKKNLEWYSYFRQNGGIAYTSDYVLDETFTLLFRRIHFNLAIASIDSIQKSIDENFLKMEWMNSNRFKKAKELRNKFKDKPNISFTDLTSMVIMSELGISDVLTEDNHFLHVGMGFGKVPGDE
ncbi:MAG: type II toxin-antitoxin system VapC family toxin [Ignavibacteriaceae bacterium]